MNQDHFHSPESLEPRTPQAPDLPGNANTYQTGSTCPPKNKNGIMAFMLVVIIVLFGAVTILGAMNIRLFRQLHGDSLGETLGISIDDDSGNSGIISDPDSQQTDHNQDEPIRVSPSPHSAENIPAADGLSLQEIYSSTIHAVVSITCTYPGGTATGTGVVLTADGYIITNAHVVEGSESIQVRFWDDRVMAGHLVGADGLSDLAVLQVDATGLEFAQLGDSSVLRVGDAVVAIGDPLGAELRGTMTDGIISAINRDVTVGGRVMNLIQTNAALNTGNSGGPLINCYGQVIGINTMKMGDSMSIGGVEGLGFAIPSNTVKDIANQLITQGYVSGRPTLGITGEDVSSLYQFYYGLPYGLYITAVEDGSAAAKVGLQAGDILLTIGQVRISGLSDYETVLYSCTPGDTLEIIVFRAGRQYSATITVDEFKN